MKYPEEAHARSLQQLLESKLGESAATTSAEGRGVHWGCGASLADSQCYAHCFDLRGLPEFLVSFQRDGTTLAWGRTPEDSEVAAAIADWVQGCSLPDLHHRHPFVDRKKRALAAIADKVVACHPHLLTFAPPALEASSCDINYLWFRSATRSCELSFWGKNPHPDAKFHWDETELFRFPVSDTDRLGEVLERWLVGEALPSAMRAEFPFMEIGPLAEHYENGTPIEGEFLQSWDLIESFFRDSGLPFRDEIMSFIAEMRQQGFDRKLRAGQSMFTMLLSRSRRHGLEPEQPYVSFWFGQGKITVIRWKDEDFNTVELPGIKLHPEIWELLGWLENEPIT